MCQGCQEYDVTREIYLPTVATASRTTVWVTDRVDSHGHILVRTYRTEPKTIMEVSVW